MVCTKILISLEVVIIGSKLKQTDGLNYEGSEQDQNRGSIRMLEKTMKFFC